MSEEKRFYPMSPEMVALKRRYQERGLLLEDSPTKRIEKDFEALGSWWLIHTHISLASKGWDVFTNAGHVLTPWFALGRERVLLPDSDTMFSSTFLFLGPVAICVGRVRLNRREAK